MTKRIIIPVENNQGLQAPLCQHFGQAPYYAIIELDDNNQISKVESKLNTSEHMGGTGNPHTTILDFKPDVIIAHAMGPGALQTFENANVKVLRASSVKVKDIIDDFIGNKLQDKVAPCPHSHHHHHEHQ
jgi:predicted Fe-Mo cluster-binding NifX family protein